MADLELDLEVDTPPALHPGQKLHHALFGDVVVMAVVRTRPFPLYDVECIDRDLPFRTSAAYLS